MVKRNPHFEKLQAGYLFPEIQRRKEAFLKQRPDAQLISLGIGDTTLPLPMHIAASLAHASALLGTQEGYSGYGSVQGDHLLRQRISQRLYQGHIDPEDIFISDGCKCDIGRLQMMFGGEAAIAVQDPTYPVYVDTSVMVGQTGEITFSGSHYGGIVYLPSLPENNFCPDLNTLPRTDLIYITSPNNPTGTVLTHRQLEEYVKIAKRNRSIIIFDAAYAMYVSDPNLPRSIYEIKGAEEVAIELGSFSKIAGFTGVRLGWSIVPKTLKFEDGSSVKSDWHRMMSTFFNGASNLAQKGGIAALDNEGYAEMQQMVNYYLTNAALIKGTFDQLQIENYGGKNSPYIWARFPGKDSWKVFEEFLTNLEIVTTPGAGFGPAGAEFIRISAFGKRQDIKTAMKRLKNSFLLK